MSNHPQTEAEWQAYHEELDKQERVHKILGITPRYHGHYAPVPADCLDADGMMHALRRTYCQESKTQGLCAPDYMCAECTFCVLNFAVFVEWYAEHKGDK